MSAPQPPRPASPAGCANWLDYVLTPEVSVWTSYLSPKDCARAELAELRKELADTKRIKEVACRDLETWQVSYDAAHKALEQAKAQLALQAANTVEAMQQRDAAQAERDAAQERVDLDVDEFRRIMSLLDGESLTLASEIQGLCDRAIRAGRQHVPVIEQRDAAVQERDSLRAQVAELRGAVLGLGELIPESAHAAWNEIVAKLRAEPAGQEGQQ